MIHKPSTVRTFLQLYEVGKSVGQTPEIQPDEKNVFDLILKPMSYAKKQSQNNTMCPTLLFPTVLVYLSE